jgi:hypothetical protein
MMATLKISSAGSSFGRDNSDASYIQCNRANSNRSVETCIKHSNCLLCLKVFVCFFFFGVCVCVCVCVCVLIVFLFGLIYNYVSEWLQI